MTGCVGLHEPVPHLLCAGLVLRESGGEAGAPPARADAPGPRQPKRELLRQVSTRDAPGPRQPQHELLRQVSTGDAPGPRQPCQVSTRDSSVLVTGSVAVPPIFRAAPAPAQAPEVQGLGDESGYDQIGSAPAPAPAQGKKGRLQAAPTPAPVPVPDTNICNCEL